jgi:hypothetical protein
VLRIVTFAVSPIIKFAVDGDYEWMINIAYGQMSDHLVIQAVSWFYGNASEIIIDDKKPIKANPPPLT